MASVTPCDFIRRIILGTWFDYAHDTGHLNSAYDDGYTVSIAEVPAHELEENGITEATTRRSTRTSGIKDLTNYRGVVWFNKQCDRWMLKWWQDGTSRAKTIGTKEQFPTEQKASRAAEPLRQWFREHPEIFKQTRTHDDVPDPATAADIRAEREAIAADIVKAKREQSDRTVEALFHEQERSPQYLFRTGKYIFDAYVYQKLSSDMRGSLRAFRYDSETASRGCNRHFMSASKSDFLADCELTFRRSLTAHQRALIKLLFLDFKATEEEVERCWPGELYRMYVTLGRVFREKGMNNLGAYYAPFPHPRDRNKSSTTEQR